MTCWDCAGQVTRALEQVAGVSEVHVSLATDEATVRFDGQLATPEQMISAVQHAGFGVRIAKPSHDYQAQESCFG
jgi:Cu+-exporting ATPase